MKRILGLLLFILSVPCFAADNIKMVTYFPVPYLAYNELGVVGTCDLGLMGSCSLDAGRYLSVRPNAGLTQTGLNRGVISLKGRELDLQSTALTPQVQSYVLRVGDRPTSKTQEALLTFRHRLEVGTLQGGDLQSIEADNTAYMNSLTLFGSTFPACAKDNHQISWQRLAFDKRESTFLVCGQGESACEDSYGKWTTTLGLTPMDTCDGDSTAAFTCSGTAKTCRDVRTTTHHIKRFKPEYGNETMATYADVDSCDRDAYKKIDFYLGCTEAKRCTDVFRDASGIEACKCGGKVGNTHLPFTCAECEDYGIGKFGEAGSGVSDTYCDRHPGTSCCNNGTPLVCPYIKRRTITCVEYAPTIVEYRTVTCCGSTSGGGHSGSDPVTKKLVWTKVPNSVSFGVKCPGGYKDPMFHPTGATMGAAPSGTCRTEGEKRYIILGIGGAGAEALADPYSSCRAQRIGRDTVMAQGETYECKKQ